MLKTLTDLQKAYLFVCLAIGFVIAGSLILPENANVSILAFIPLLTVLIMMFVTKEMFTKKGWTNLNFHRFPVKLFFIGLLVPIVPTLVGYSFIWNFGLADFSVPAEAEGKWLLVILSTILTFVVVSLTTILGEEIGWRGYLLPKLYKLGLQQAFFLSAIIWGIFHLPVMLLTDGYHAEMNLFLYIPLFIANITFAGFFIGYLCYKGGSIWPAISAHSAHNMVWAYCEQFTTSSSTAAGYLTGDAGLFGIGFYLAVYFIIRNNLSLKHTDIHPVNQIAR